MTCWLHASITAMACSRSGFTITRPVGRVRQPGRFLQEHKIPFCRYTEGKYDYEPEVVAFHPACGLVQELTDHSRNPIVQTAAVKAIADKLAKILAEMQRGEVDAARLQRKLQRLYGKLCKCLPADVPALETFEVIEG